MKNQSLKDVRVPVEIVLGETELSVEALAGIGIGSIVEIPKLAGEPVDLKAGGAVVARGEVVVIDKVFGVRVTEILASEE